MADCSKTVGVARSRLNYRCHVCAFFHSREDEYKILIPFMREGLDAGDRAVQIVGAEHRAEQIRRLTETGVDTLAAEQRGQLGVQTWEDSVLRGGRFNQHAMIGALQEIATDGEQRGSASPEFGRTWDGRLEISLACMTSSSTSRGSTMSYRNMTLLQSAPMT